MFRPFFRRNSAPPAARRPMLSCVPLDDRLCPARSVNVIPMSLPADDFNTFYRLSDAITAAGNDGTVTVRAGATPEDAISVTKTGVTIQGDTNLPAQALPAYSIYVDSDYVKLRNMNLSYVQGYAGAYGLEVSRSFVGGLSINQGSASATNGGLLLAFNRFSGTVYVNGNSNDGTTFDVIEHNTFDSFIGPVLNIGTQNQITVRGNTFTTFAEDAVSVNNTKNLTFQNNTVTVRPGDTLGVDYLALKITGVSSGLISTNRFDTGGDGTGLFMQANFLNDAGMAFRVEGNDFHNNTIGVRYVGGGNTPNGVPFSANNIMITSIGGAVAGLSSNGGNNFRGFTTAGTGIRGGIVLSNTHPQSPPMAALLNVFGTTASTFGNVAPGALSANQALVMNLFIDALGRPATTGDISGWLGQSTSQAFLANGIGKSNEAVGVLVDGLYRQYLKRNPDSSGRAGFIGAINNGVQSYDTVRSIIVSSAEYVSSNPFEPVQSYYVNLLNRSASVPEIQSWYQQLPALTLFGVANGFVTSYEYRTKFLQNELFRPMLHRSPSSGDFNALAGNASLDLLALRVIVYSAPEYLAVR